MEGRMALALGLLEDTATLLKRTQTNLKKCPKARLTKGYLEVRLQSVEDYWTTFRKAHQDLIASTPREKRAEVPYFVNEEYYIYEDLYLCIQAEVKDMLSVFTKPPLPTESSASRSNTSSGDNSFQTQLQAQVRLPKISVPSFSGNYDDWPTFQDMFTSMIHSNSSINKVDKLNYLKSCLHGEAEGLLRNIKVTETNYDLAWETLKQRYCNKRLIVNTVLKRFVLQRKLSVQSATRYVN